MPGAGTNLHDMIARWTGEKPDLSCSCRRWIKKMDKKPEWARAHVDLIVEKLMKEAQSRAKKWRAVKMDDTEGLLDGFAPGGEVIDTAKRAAWKGVFMIPGAKMTLAAMVRRMVESAIASAEQEMAEQEIFNG